MTKTLKIGLASGLIIWLLSFVQLQAWSDSLLIRAHFDDRPLVEVLDQLTVQYKIRFAYEPASIEGIKITAYIESRPLNEAIALILGASGLDYKILQDRQVMIRPGVSDPERASALDKARPQTMRLEGYIKDAENAMPLPYANISIPGTRYGTIGQKDGRFIFIVPYTEESIELKISYLGYEGKRVQLSSGKRRVVVGLQARSRVLEVVEIEEKQPLLLNSEEISKLILSSDRLPALPSLGAHDLFQALKYLPGVNGLDESSVGLSVRGGTENENLILLDGISLYYIDHFWGVFSSFNPEAIDQVEVYKSNFPLKYGGRTSSVINLSGKSADPDKLHASLGTNLLSSQFKLELPIANKLSLLVAARRSYSDIIQSDLYKNLFELVRTQENLTPTPDSMAANMNSLSLQTPDYYFYDVHAKAMFRPTEGEDLSLSFFQGVDVLDLSTKRDFFYPRRGIPQRAVESTTNKTKWLNRGASFQWQKQWLPQVESELSLSFSQFEKSFELATTVTRSSRDMDITRLRSSIYDLNKIDDVSFRPSVNWQLNANNQISIGGAFNRNAVKYQFEVNDRRPLRRDQLDTLGNTTSLFVEHTFQNQKGLELRWGLRDTYYSNTAQHYLSPRFSLQYQLDPHLQLKAAWGQYYQFTKEVYFQTHLGKLRSFWGLANGENVPVNKAIHYVLGFSVKYPDFLLDVEAYRKDMSGLVIYSTLRYVPGAIRNNRPAPVYAFFQGQGVSTGLDILLQKSSGLYTGWIAYSLGKVEHQYEGLNRGKAFAAEEDQRHELKFINMLRLGKWDLSLTWIYGSGKAFTNLSNQFRDNDINSPQDNFIQEERLPAYHRIDLGATYNFNLGPFDGEAGGSIYNLIDRTNVKYRQFLYTFEESRSVAGRTITRVIGDDAQLLGFTPNVFLNIRF